jgi:hypothetical protein
VGISALPVSDPKRPSVFFEFFTVPIRNKNTRSAYYQAIDQFLDWCQRAGCSNIEDIEPIHVAVYIEQHSVSAATIKQHMARIRIRRNHDSAYQHKGCCLVCYP